MKGKATTILLVVVLIAGLSLLLYPTVSNYWNSLHQSRVVSRYDKAVADISKKDYEAIIEAARAYNRGLLTNPNRLLANKEQEAEYKKLLNITGNDVMGYIVIPKISVRLPLYHGTSEAVLQVGVGHITGTSLPVGGESTHCVLSGHSGLPSAILFTNLDQLKLGDRFSLHVFGDVLYYDVDQILVVDPDNVTPLDIIPGEDHVTLVTCTPYGINTHRLLVRAARSYPAAVEIVNDAERLEAWVSVALIAGPLFLISVIILLFFRKIIRGKPLPFEDRRKPRRTR